MSYVLKDEALVFKHISDEEGCRLDVYEDSLGQAHVGYGHLMEGKQTQQELEILGGLHIESISQEQADALLKLDIQDALRDVESIFTQEEWDSFDSVRQCVIHSQAYQLGGFGLSRFKNMIAAMKEGDWSRAADESRDSLAYKQTTERWDRQAEMLVKGEQTEVVDNNVPKNDEVSERLGRIENQVTQIYDYLISNKKRR